MKALIFALVAVAALGLVINDPRHQAEGAAVVASVSDTVDPYLQRGFSEDAQETVQIQSENAAEFVQQAGDEFGLDYSFDADK